MGVAASWSCDQNIMHTFSLTYHKESSHEVWVQLGQWFAAVKSQDNAISVTISFADGKGSGESVHLYRLAWAFVTVSKDHVLAQMAIYVPFIWAAKAVASLHQ